MPDSPRTPTNYDIRLVTAAEYLATRIGQYAFGASPQPPNTDEDDRWQRYLEPLRLTMSYEDGVPVAKVGVQPMTINVRGAIVPMGGVGGVSTLPAGRRKGHVRALMTDAFARMREDGLPVSVLYPFRESFYERLGYAGWPLPRYATLHPADLLPLLRVEKPIAFEHVLIADGYDTWVAFLSTYQREQHGFALRHPGNMIEVQDGNKHWLVFVREGDEVTGAMTYRITGYHEAMLVHTFYARTATARYGLLEWIARHADQVKEARIRLTADALPELWVRDAAAHTATIDREAWDPPMGRIVSVDALGGIPAGDGEVTLNITDEHCPWNGGAWTLRGAGGTLEVSRAAAKATAITSLTIQGLASLLFTGTDPEALHWRGWGTVTEVAADQLRALFPPAVPYLHEEF